VVRCECGTEKEVQQSALLQGVSRSCGCFAHDLLFEHNAKGKLPNGEAAFNALVGRYRWHAEDRGFEFSLTKEKSLELTQSNCKYCDLEPLQCYKINSGEKYIYNGIDRVNNKKKTTLWLFNRGKKKTQVWAPLALQKKKNVLGES